MDSKSKGTLLIVDDEEEIGLLLSEAVEDLGYQCVVAKNGEEGLLAFCTNDIQAVLCDVTMPKMNGIDFLTATRNLGFNVPFVFLSAYNREEVINQVFWMGAEEYLLKPLDMNKIGPAIEKAIKHGKLTGLTGTR